MFDLFETFLKPVNRVQQFITQSLFGFSVLFLLLSFGLSYPLLANTTQPTIKKWKDAEEGVFDLSNYDFSSGLLELRGDWEFTWLKKGQSDNSTGYVNFPGSWKGKQLDGEGEELPGKGAAILKLKILLNEKAAHENLALYIPKMISSSEIKVNGESKALVGQPALSKKEYKAKYKILVLPVAGSKELDIEIFVANYLDRFGGMSEPIKLGRYSDIQEFREGKLSRDLFIFGALLIMGIYHFILFTLRQKDPSTLAYGIFVFSIAIRQLVTGEIYFTNLFPDFSFEWMRKIEFWTFYIAAPAFAWFIRFNYPSVMSRIFTIGYTALSALFILHVLIFPVNVYNQYLMYYQIAAAFAGSYAIYVLIRAALGNQEGARVALAGWGIFFLFVINDVLYDIGVVHTGTFVPAGLFLFILFKSVILAIRFTHSFIRTEQLSENLALTNEAYSHFVPQQVLKFLDRNSIINIHLGDQIERDMTILFTDIRNFTTLSENMTPEENFAFLNDFFRRIGPEVRLSNGFIDKYIGDAVMALFPGSPEDGIKAAFAIRKALREFNQERIDNGKKPIEIGTGLHMGKLMLGTVGEEERMDATVISDAVNTASRLEGLTKTFGTRIIVSMSMIMSIPDSSNIPYRLLGKVRVKGKSVGVEIAELIDVGDDDFNSRKKLESRDEFHRAVKLFEEKEFSKAEIIFENVLSENPEDAPAAWYVAHLKDMPAKRGAELLNSGNE